MMNSGFLISQKHWGLFLWGLLSLPVSGFSDIVELERRPGSFVSVPFSPGFSVLERGASWFYGLEDVLLDAPGVASFPQEPVVGAVRIPVFLIDWADFDPTEDESNHDNPNSVYPSYVRSSREEMDVYLNGEHGVSDYFRIASGGKLDVHFDVHPWLSSRESHYLDDKEPAYYTYSEVTSRWEADRADFATDVIRAMVGDRGVDLRDYDVEHNGILDGFIIVYEGHAGKLAGTNSLVTNGSRAGAPYFSPAFDNVASLVDPDSPEASRFIRQPLLFNRYAALPEMGGGGKGSPSSMTPLSLWVHEVGHLLLGYRDYYLGSTDLGVYALSARAGLGVPFQPAALEKWLFGKWIQPTRIRYSGAYSLSNHHLERGDSYLESKHYLLRVLVGGDPFHYLSFEYRDFLAENPLEIRPFDRDWNPVPPESGIVVFEVNRHLTTSDQIRRLVPDRVKELPSKQRVGAFLPGDVLDFRSGDFWVRASEFQSATEVGTLKIEFPGQLEIEAGGLGTTLRYAIRDDVDQVIEETVDLERGRWIALPDAPHNAGSVFVPRLLGDSVKFFRLVTKPKR